MTVNFTDPKSIAVFYRVHPTRHGPQLAAFAKMWPEFAQPITQAGEILRNKT